MYPLLRTMPEYLRNTARRRWAFRRSGMFTYYLLKILSETKGQVTLGELGDYLRREVKRESFDENNKMQTPTVNASSALANSWRSMKLR